VLVPAFTFPATALAVLNAGYVPVLADVDRESWTLTPALAHAQLAHAYCRAVVPVAALGCPVDVAGFDQLAMARGVAVVVDGAGAFGLQDVGTAPVAFSLHATKPLGIGEGGLVVTRDAAFAQRVRQQSNFGFQQHALAVAGTNAKLSEYAAAVGLAQLSRAAEVFARRRVGWERLRTALQGVEGVTLQRGMAAAGPAVLAVRIPGDGSAGRDALAAQGIESRRWYCPPLHRHPALAALPRAGALDVAEDLDAHLVGVPFHAFLTAADCDRIAGALRGALGASR
jgi:dTDP-4-amino-4,6-dideoxygalactose transaminase